AATVVVDAGVVAGHDWICEYVKQGLAVDLHVLGIKSNV
ncbi:hypothetical protein L915_16126, partial [Phytophthora nicotianae]